MSIVTSKPTTDASTLRYSRQTVLREWGEAGQRRLASARVFLIGLGGLGNPAASYLAGAGVGQLVLNDFDTVDASNLARQPLFTTADIGARKTAVACEALRALNPDIGLQCLDRRLDARELDREVRRCNIVVDGSDNFATRFAVNRACVSARVPLVSGAAIRYEAQLGVFRTDIDGEPCYRCLYDENADEMGDCAGHGICSPLAGVIGAAMALETLRLIVGFGAPMAGSLLVHDALAGNWRRLRIERDRSCPVCGPRQRQQGHE